MARPEIPKEELLSRAVSFRLTERDYKAYKTKFSAAGVKQSQFFRDNVLSNRTHVVAKSPSPNAERAVFILSKASNNINQLAHRANLAHLDGTLTAAVVDALIGQLQSLNSFMLDQVKEASK
jgi:hypothetical protein